MRGRLSGPLGLKERDSFYDIMISNYRPFGFFRFMLASMVVISHTHILAGEGISGLLAPYGLGNMAVMSFLPFLDLLLQKLVLHITPDECGHF